MSLKTETKAGSDCSGSDGASNRILTLTNTGLTSSDGLSVSVGYSLLANGTDFTISHLSASSTITFLNAVYNSQSIVITYQQEPYASSVFLSTVGGIATLLAQSYNNIPDSVVTNMSYFVEMAKQFVANYVGVTIDSNSIDPIYQNPIYYFAAANLIDILNVQIGSGNISLAELSIGTPNLSKTSEENRFLGEMALKNIGRKTSFARSLS